MRPPFSPGVITLLIVVALITGAWAGAEIKGDTSTISNAGTYQKEVVESCDRIQVSHFLDKDGNEMTAQIICVNKDRPAKPDGEQK